METAWPAVRKPACDQSDTGTNSGCHLIKRINSEKDVIHFKSKSPAYKDTLLFINLLSEKIHGTSNKIFNYSYSIKCELFQKCSKLLDELALMCDATDLSKTKSSVQLRFGHIAFRDWFEEMRVKCKSFVADDLAPGLDQKLQDELVSYLTDSFGNKMRIDYGTGHELSFLIFAMGLLYLTPKQTSGDSQESKNLPFESLDNECKSSQESLKSFVDLHGWDILSLFAHKYLSLCRKIQVKFRLEPAGSRGVYNMDDFQYLPFLFGAAQLVSVKYIPTKEFYDYDTVDMFKKDFMFFEAIDFILNNKRGPFNEHSYTLWCLMDLNSWDLIYRRIKMKFTEDVLGPFPIVQHLLFGKFILKWDSTKQVEDNVSLEKH